MTMSANRRLLCSLFTVLWAATLSQAQQVPLPAPSTGTIVGTVLDATGSTVPNATVVLQGTAPDDHRTVVTGDNGFFKFDPVNPGVPMRVVVSAPDLTKWGSKEIVLQPGQDLIVTGISLTVPPVETSVNALTQEQVAAQQVKIQEQQRVFGVIPN